MGITTISFNKQKKLLLIGENKHKTMNITFPNHSGLFNNT